MNIKKFAWTFAIALPLFCFNISANAETRLIEATGQYIVGDSPSENVMVAKQRAREDAKRRAAEQAGVYVRSYSKIVNLALVEDEVTSIASQILAIKQEDVRFSSTGGGEAMVITCKIIAEVDTNNILFAGKQQADYALTQQHLPPSTYNSIPKEPNEIIQTKPVEQEKPVVIQQEKNTMNPNTVVVNKNVSINTQRDVDNGLINCDFIPKPQNFVGDKSTKLLKANKIKYIPDPKHWSCLGVRKFPYFYGEFKDFKYHIDVIVWIAPESVVRRGNKMRYQAVMLEPNYNVYKVTNYIIDFDEQYQAMLKGKEYSCSSGKFVKEDTQRAKGLKLKLDDRGIFKDLLHTDFMRQFLNY